MLPRVGAVEALEDAVADDASLLLDAHVVGAEVEPSKEGSMRLCHMYGTQRQPNAKGHNHNMVSLGPQGLRNHP